MSLPKRTYVAGETKITATNLNNIQDAIIALENANLDSRLTTAEGKITTLEGKFDGGNLNSSSSTSFSLTRGIVFMFRNGNATVALVDQWNTITYLSQATNYVVSVESNVVTLRNNASSYCNYGVIAF